MATTVESSVDLSQLRRKCGVNSVSIRGKTIVMDIDEFFARSILSHVDTWHTNLSLHDINFEDEQLVFKVDA